MTEIFHFDGIIKSFNYTPQINDDLTTYEFSDFDVNTVDRQGIIKLQHGNLGYSIWDSPLQSKFYPFARVYNTYGPISRSIAIIPVLRDDGADGKLEHIQYSALSWMNLANVYIVFAYFDEATRTPKVNQHKLINRKLNSETVRLQIERLMLYRSSALHWNCSQFGQNFKSIYKRAIRAYEKISRITKTKIHPNKIKLSYIDKLRADCQKYEGISIDGSKSTRFKNDKTLHENKYVEGRRNVFYLNDGLGGVYYLTAKDVWRSTSTYVIQETRIARKGFLPSLRQIQDGIFRLIFFGNIDTLYRNGYQVKFQPRLSLFGSKVNGTLFLPCKDKEFNVFVRKNKDSISKNELEILNKLRLEVEKNQCFALEIAQKA